jgi:hypothetical protein
VSHRKIMTLFGLAAVAAFAAGPARADDPQGEHRHHFEACAKACADCARECESCATHCAHLLAQGHKDHQKTLATCRDCAEFCTAAARITSRMGPMSGLICEACAKACDTCGGACDKFSDDAHMKRCAEACKKCAEACRDMLKHTGGPGTAR